MKLAHDIGKLLEAQGIGTVGIDIFLGVLPFDIASGVNIVLGGGGRSSIYMPVFDNTVEIFVRDPDSDEAYDKIKSIYDYLQRLSNIKTENAYVYFAGSLTDIEDLGEDQNSRRLFRTTMRVIFREDNLIS